MNGNYGNNASLLSPTQGVGPGGRQIMEGYRKDIMNGFAQDQPRYNPVRTLQERVAPSQANREQ